MHAVVAAKREPSNQALVAANKAAQRATRPQSSPAKRTPALPRSPRSPAKEPPAPPLLPNFLASRVTLLASQPPAEAMKLSPRLMPYRPTSAQPADERLLLPPTLVSTPVANTPASAAVAGEEKHDDRLSAARRMSVDVIGSSKHLVEARQRADEEVASSPSSSAPVSAQPTARSHAAMACIGWGEARRVALFGGVEPHGELAAGVLHVFDPAGGGPAGDGPAGDDPAGGGSWSTPPVRGRAPTQRSGATASSLGCCRALFFGGVSHNGERHSMHCRSKHCHRIRTA